VVDTAKSFETLDVQVRALEVDVRDIKSSIGKLADEVRSALTGVASQLSQHQRTPWVSIGSIGTILIGVLSFIFSQALSPMLADIRMLKENALPKDEALFRYNMNDRRLNNLEGVAEKIQTRRYEELTKLSDNLRMELMELRRQK
jgi:hypothetical protein